MLFFVRSVKFDISLFATVSDISALFVLVLLLLLLLLLMVNTIMVNYDYDDDVNDYYYSLRGEAQSVEQSEFIISSRAKRPRSAWTASGS